MTPFLKIVADDLYQKLKGDFQDACIIFPNKRASLFFNQYLWENSHGHTMWTPEYTTISELFISLSEYTLGDPIYLAVKLWEVYQEKMQPTKSLDQLYPLMEMMLSDFQDIDNNMVEPTKLFVNISELKEMTDFSFLEEEQRQAIEQFFGKYFEGETANTTLKTRFKVLWNHLTDIYTSFQSSLLHTENQKPMVYEGMLKHQVIETLNSADEALQLHTSQRLAAKNYVVVGFNVLNKTEKELFLFLKQHRNTKFYWDYDQAYTKRPAQPSNLLSKYEAGQFILENIRLLGNEFEGQDLFRNMQCPKAITFIQSPTENAQTRYIHEWGKKHLKTDEPLNQSAVILCNENLLQSVLHSIGDVPAINVTMGYPLDKTPIFSLVQSLLDLQIHGHTQFGAWRYKYVAAVMKHAFTQRLIGQACEEKLTQLQKDNVIFPTSEMFADNITLQRIFTPVSGKELTTYLADIISRVGHTYQNAFGSKDFTLQIYKESIFVAYTVVNRIHTLQEQHPTLVVGNDMLMRLILQLMSQATIPFHGEPAIGLQVMGLLETRNLDFRNIIMLSVNEGQMPKSDKRPSLIPYTLRAAFGMTTIEKEVSLYAYYYYRLMQRAENITLLYNSSTEGGGKGEMSRFMLQSLAEKDELFGSETTISLKSFATTSEMQASPTLCVKKTPYVMEKLHARFNAEHILSPSAINTYMKCPLKFYFNYVANLRPADDVSEDVDSPMFGIILHDAIHHIYEPYEGKTFTSAEALALASNENLLLQKINNAFAVNLFHYPEKDAEGHYIDYGGMKGKRLIFNGTQLINRHVIKQFVINQIQADAKMAASLESEGGYWQIISQEERYTTMHKGILLGGIIDRLDLLVHPAGNRIRIVDYKTSSKPHAAKVLADLFDPDKCITNYHIMQTLYYCTVLTAQGSPYQHSTVVPALMYCAKDYGNNYSGIIKLIPPRTTTKEEVTDFQSQYANDFNALLTQKIDEIFTPYNEDTLQPADNTLQPPTDMGLFTQCTDEQHCLYCDFLTFCRRHPKRLKD